MAKKVYKVDEVYAGCCTKTIRGPMVQKAIAKAAKEGWTFEGTQSVVGRNCCAQYYVLLIVYSKEGTEVV